MTMGYGPGMPISRTMTHLPVMKVRDCYLRVMT